MVSSPCESAEKCGTSSKTRMAYQSKARGVTRGCVSRKVYCLITTKTMSEGKSWIKIFSVSPFIILHNIILC